MKALPLLLSIALVATAAGDRDGDNLTLVSDEKLKELNNAGLIDVVFWMKPSQRRPANDSQPRWEQDWRVTIANHSKTPVTINKNWFLWNDWMSIHDAKTKEQVARLSSHPTDEIDEIEIPAQGRIELPIRCILAFDCLIPKAKKDEVGVVFERHGSFVLTHSKFPKASLRFAVSESGGITIVYPSPYSNRTKTAEQDGAEQPATAPDSKSEGSEKPKPESEGRSQ